jgi:ribonuclease R
MNTLYEGVLMVRGKGTGFLSHPDFSDDIVIERDNLECALDGDIVAVTIKPGRRGERTEGKVSNIIQRHNTTFIGVVKKNAETGAYYLHPDNRRIHVKFELPDAQARDVDMKVVVSITHWIDATKNPVGTIVETIGRAGDHETEMQAIIRGGGFSHQFPEVVQAEAQTLHNNKETIFADALANPTRRDLRHITTFTIDPADAKDFDDALSIQSLDNGNVEIGIHIADVSHYVTPGSELDKEARERATSIYLVDRVIPMLPEILSNDLCSLRPNEDRLAFSAVFELTPQGEVRSEWYGQTIINSNRRFSYEEAQAILDDNAGDFLNELTTMMSISRNIRRQRFTKGAIAFEQPEIKFELDQNGTPIRAYKKNRTETMMMIEDYMLLANEQVATHIHNLSKTRSRDLVFVYRIHDVPDPEKIEELAIFIRALGYEFETNHGTVKATDINTLLKEIEGKPEENLIKTATIRSMAKAIYSTKNIGHFGLAFKFYTHFTSPIRRYPDLIAHRLLRLHLDNTPIKQSEATTFENISIKSSKREIEAVSAERDSIKFKQVEYLTRAVGTTFEAVITGVTDWGIYVQEQQTLAEGMVRLASIKTDFFEHEASKYRIRGQRTGKIYRLGDPVTVILTRADMEERQLDFSLVS